MVRDLGEFDDTLIVHIVGDNGTIHHLIDIVPTILEPTGITAQVMVDRIAQKADNHGEAGDNRGRRSDTTPKK